MAADSPTAEILIRYPQVRGYIMKSYEMKRILGARFDAVINDEAHEEACFSLFLNGTEVYSEPVNSQARVYFSQCIDALRRHNVTELSGTPASLPDRHDQGDDADPDHRRWLNNVCSGE